MHTIYQRRLHRLLLFFLVISDMGLIFGQLQSLACLPIQSDLCIKRLHTFFREHHGFLSIVTGMSMEVGVIRCLEL